MVETDTARQIVHAEPGTLIQGVSPVLAVPFHDDGALDHAGFDRVVRYVLGCGVSSVMFPGYASEFLKLSTTERWDLYEILFSHTRGRHDIAAVAAVQDHATRLAVDHATRLVDAGADAINLLPPYQLHPAAEDVRAHIHEVAAAVDPVPIVLQYAPQQTGTTLDASTIAAIARTHPNVRVVKVESVPPGRLIHDLLQQRPALPSMVGYAGVQLPDALRRGAIGVQPGCSFTEIYVEIWRCHSNGDHDGAFELHRRLLPYVSYWMLNSELIVAAEKLISARRGLFASAFCRRPAYHLDEEDLRMVDRFLAEFDDLLPRLDDLS